MRPVALECRPKHKALAMGMKLGIILKERYNKNQETAKLCSYVTSLSLGNQIISGRFITTLTQLALCRHIFLFDMAAIVCKRRGDNYEMKDILDLNNFKVTNNPTSDKEGKKVRGGHLCAIWLPSTLSIAYFLLLACRWGNLQKMPFREMSASGFIAVISVSNKSRTALLCLAAVQGQLSLVSATCSSWWTFWLPLVGMCARGDLLMPCWCAPQMASSHHAVGCWFETDSVTQHFLCGLQVCVVWHVAVIVIQHVQRAALLLVRECQSNSSFISFLFCHDENAPRRIYIHSWWFW